RSRMLGRFLCGWRSSRTARRGLALEQRHGGLDRGQDRGQGVLIELHIETLGGRGLARGCDCGGHLPECGHASSDNGGGSRVEQRRDAGSDLKRRLAPENGGRGDRALEDRGEKVTDGLEETHDASYGLGMRLPIWRLRSPASACSEL